MVEQATAVDALSAAAAKLSGYGRGIAAVEAGVADLRLVDKMRSAPTPASWDKELKSVYEAALDEALEPRKSRGRDATLVGFADLAEAGHVKDERVTRARTLLAKLYGGRRIDALDQLMLPAWEAPKSLRANSPAVAALTPFWLDDGVRVGLGYDTDLSMDPASLARGVMRNTRFYFSKVPAEKLSADLGKAYPRARLDVGRVYWRRVDFTEAAHVAKDVSTRDPSNAEARFYLALALALARGPNGAKEMMTAPSPAALHLDHTEALDVVASENDPYAGLAAFDAAYLRSLSPPDGPAAAPYMKDVAARFKKAASLLGDAALKKLAEDRANDAEAAARAAAGEKTSLGERSGGGLAGGSRCDGSTRSSADTGGIGRALGAFCQGSCGKSGKSASSSASSS